MYANNELMFPNEAISSLRNLRGEGWRSLVDHVDALPGSHPEKLAFVLLMIRLNGCLDCETDSYRAMRGCAACAIQTLRRFKGSEAELLEQYQQALQTVEEYMRHTEIAWRIA